MIKTFINFIREVNTRYIFRNYYYVIIELKFLFNKKIEI